jgi:hypothetical protein
LVEAEQFHGGEGICRIDGNGDKNEEPEPDVGDDGDAIGGLEVIEILGEVLVLSTAGGWVTYNVVPFLLIRYCFLLPSASTEAIHGDGQTDGKHSPAERKGVSRNE